MVTLGYFLRSLSGIHTFFNATNDEIITKLIFALKRKTGK